jgi:Arc/MetJ-type ribon-helix-helix transcriptional regulator
MDSQIVSIRIPQDLLEKIDRIAKERYPQRNGKPANRSQVILDAIEKMDESDKFSELVFKVEELWKAVEAIGGEVYDLQRWRSEQVALETPPANKSDLTELTNAELARILGVNPATVSRWANGKRQPPSELKYKFDSTTKVWTYKS